MRVLGLIHSTRLVIESTHHVIASQCPDIDYYHVMDEGILRKLTASGQNTPEIVQWLTGPPLNLSASVGNAVNNDGRHST